MLILVPELSEVVSCANAFEALSLLSDLVYQVFDPLELEFCARLWRHGSVYILLHAFIQLDQHHLLKISSGGLPFSKKKSRQGVGEGKEKRETGRRGRRGRRGSCDLDMK